MTPEWFVIKYGAAIYQILRGQRGSHPLGETEAMLTEAERKSPDKCGEIVPHYEGVKQPKDSEEDYVSALLKGKSQTNRIRMFGNVENPSIVGMNEAIKAIQRHFTRCYEERKVSYEETEVRGWTQVFTPGLKKETVIKVGQDEAVAVIQSQFMESYEERPVLYNEKGNLINIHEYPAYLEEICAVG